jgi:organic radical activating enzyme
LKQVEKEMEHVDKIYFTGGEPTLIKAHWNLLQKFIDSGHAHHISLDYNTNASSIRDEYFQIWSKFKKYI